jgi:uncharacterized protein (DUF1499 family)
MWTSRVALFSALVLVAAVFLPRLFAMSTPIALNLVAASFIGAGLALLLGLAAAVQIWQTGAPGAARVVLGVVVGLGLVVWPLAYLPAMQTLPAINDLSTDTAAPPQFVALAKSRPENRVAYPGTAFASAQAKAYPDLRPLTVNRSAEEAFEIVSEAVRIEKLKIVREEAPPAAAGKGYLEAIDRTLVFGFYDDIAIRIDGDARQARIDIRSASRYGRHDFGRNADRMRHLLKTINARLEATVPTAAGERVPRWHKKLPRWLKDRHPGSGGGSPAGDRGPADARHGPRLKGQQPGAEERPGRGRRSGQSFE